MTPEAALWQLLDERGAGKTICPSEIARALAGENGDWRARMDEVHAAVRGIARHGGIKLSWKGEATDVGDGPYRIARTP